MKLDKIANQLEEKLTCEIEFEPKTYYIVYNTKRIILSVWPIILLLLIIQKIIPCSLPDPVTTLLQIIILFASIVSAIELTELEIKEGAKASAKGGTTTLTE